MAGGISSENRVFDTSGVTFDNEGEAYSGSDVNALASPRLANHYRMKLDSADAETLSISWASAISVQFVGLCGIATESGTFTGWDKFRMTFYLGGAPIVAAQTDFDTSNMFQGCSVFDALDAETSIDEIRVIPFEDAAADAWASLGTVWVGKGLLWGSGSHLFADWSNEPVDVDRSSISRGGQMNSHRGNPRDITSIEVGLARSLSHMNPEDLTGLRGIGRQAGTGGYVATCKRFGDPRLSAYGRLQGVSKLRRGAGDIFSKQFIVEGLS